MCYLTYFLICILGGIIIGIWCGKTSKYVKKCPICDEKEYIGDDRCPVCRRVRDCR